MTATLASLEATTTDDGNKSGCNGEPETDGGGGDARGGGGGSGGALRVSVLVFV